MDRQVVDPGLNIVIQQGEHDWRPALQNGKKMYTCCMAAVQIVARHRIVMLDDTVLSLSMYKSCPVLKNMNYK